VRDGCSYKNSTDSDSRSEYDQGTRSHVTLQSASIYLFVHFSCCSSTRTRTRREAMYQLALRITHLITFRHLTKPLIKGYHSRPSEVKIAWILSIISSDCSIPGSSDTSAPPVWYTARLLNKRSPFDMLNSAIHGEKIRCQAIKRCARPFPHLSRSSWSVSDIPTISASRPRFMPRLISASRPDHVPLSDVCGNVGLYLHILRDHHAIMF
jgi:hypothetical protein